MTGVEIDMVVSDSLAALRLYENVFEAQRIEVTVYSKGNNEAVFSIYGSRFHLLDENPAYQLVAPKPEDPKPLWLNVMVPDINATWQKAMAAGCGPVQPLTEMPEMGVTNAMFTDPFGYLWMLHQVHREVSFEERSRIMEQHLGIAPQG